MTGQELAATLMYNPFQIAAYLTSLQGRKDQQELKDQLDEPTGAGHGYIQLRTSCGHNRFVRELCSDPLCSKCEAVRAFERRQRWYPVLKAMRYPRFITLTIPDGPDLAERINFLQASFRRFLQMRLGGRNIKRFNENALIFAGHHFEQLIASGTMDPLAAAAELRTWQESLEKFSLTLTRRKDKKGQWPRLRHIIGKGFASLEITFQGDWHVHRHLCVDGQYIPWPLLCAVWQVATRDQAIITDIRKIDRSPESMKEVAKYISKGWEIPLDYQDEFIQAVKGLKRIWPLGGAKPVEPDKGCPYCTDPECKSKICGLANLVEVGTLWSYPYKVFEADQLTDYKRTRYVLIKRPDGRWDEVPLLDTMSVCAPVGGRSGP